MLDLVIISLKIYNLAKLQNFIICLKIHNLTKSFFNFRNSDKFQVTIEKFVIK